MDLRVPSSLITAWPFTRRDGRKGRLPAVSSRMRSPRRGAYRVPRSTSCKRNCTAPAADHIECPGEAGHTVSPRAAADPWPKPGDKH